MDYSAVLIPAITLIISQIIMIDLAQFRFPRKKVITIFIIESLIIALIGGSLLFFGGLKMYAKLYVPVMVIPLAFTYIFVSKRRDLRDVFNILTTIFISTFISVISMWISKFYGSSYLSYILSRIIIFAILLFIIHKFLRNNYILIQDEIDKGWGIFCMLPIIGIAVIYYSFLQYSKTGNFMEVLYVCSITMLIMVNVYALIFYVFIQLHEKYMILEQKRIISMQNKGQLELFKQFEESAEKTNRRWHDLRHNTQRLIKLLEAGDINMAMEYLKEQRDMDILPQENYCQHVAVNSILSIWSGRCKKEEISMEIKTKIPENLGIDEMEISALFANALENAYYSCIELPQEVKRYIKVEANYNGKRLAAGIENSCKEDVVFRKGIPISSKDGGGIGTRSMTYTVKRFHGTITFTAKDGVFFTRFIMNV